VGESSPPPRPGRLHKAIQTNEVLDNYSENARDRCGPCGSHVRSDRFAEVGQSCCSEWQSIEPSFRWTAEARARTSIPRGARRQRRSTRSKRRRYYRRCARRARKGRQSLRAADSLNFRSSLLCVQRDCELVDDVDANAFFPTSAYDVTAPSQVQSTIVQRTTTALGYEASITSLSPVQALASSIQASPVQLYIVMGRKSRNPLEWGSRFGFKRPPPERGSPWPTAPTKFARAARSSEGKPLGNRGDSVQAIHIRENSKGHCPIGRTWAQPPLGTGPEGHDVAPTVVGTAQRIDTVLFSGGHGDGPVGGRLDTRQDSRQGCCAAGAGRDCILCRTLLLLFTRTPKHIRRRREARTRIPALLQHVRAAFTQNAEREERRFFAPGT
jgi:hypothetical protein